MSGLISTLIIFITLMAISYALVRGHVLSENFAKDASMLSLNILICATIVNSVLINPPMLTNGETMRALLLIFLLYALFYVVALLCARFIAPTKDHVAVVMLLMAVNNNMFIGVPVAEELFGAGAVFYITLGCIPFNVILYSYGVYSLLKSGDNSRGINIKDMFCPPLIATVIALILFMADIHLPDVLVRMVGILSNATLPMSMFVIGAALSSVNLFEAFKNYRFYIISFVRLIVQPVVAWFVFRYLTNDIEFLGSCIIAAACPSGIVVTALSIQFDKDAIFPSECILVDTALSMLTIPVITALLL